MDGGAWPYLVRGVICLVDSDNERDPRLLTRLYVFERAAFLEGQLVQARGSGGQLQVSDALRCPGPQACYNGTVIKHMRVR